MHAVRAPNSVWGNQMNSFHGLVLRMNCSCPRGKNGLDCVKEYSCKKVIKSATISWSSLLK